MRTGTLTDIAIRALAATDGKRTEIWDAKIPGFGIRVSPTGTKTFVLLYYMHGRKRRITIGRFPLVSLAEARGKALKILADVAHGIDPEGPAGASSKSQFRFEDVVVEFVDKHCKRHNRPATATETARILRVTFVAVWAQRDIRDIGKSDVQTVLDAIIKAGAPSSANHALAAVRKLFSWCVERGLIDINPSANMSRPAPAPSRERVLNEAELTAIWHAAAETGYPFGTIVKLLILTAQRRGEVAAMQWSELNFEKALWSISGSRTKNGRPHTIPLSPTALELLVSTPRLNETLVFPARGNDTQPVSGFSKMKPLLAAQTEVTGWTLHDLRRTAATTLAGLSVPPHIVERILNHSSGTFAGVAGVYNRHEYIDEMRVAMSNYDRYLTHLFSKA